MTVSDLISLLQRYAPTLQVLIADERSCFSMHRDDLQLLDTPSGPAPEALLISGFERDRVADLHAREVKAPGKSDGVSAPRELTTEGLLDEALKVFEPLALELRTWDVVDSVEIEALSKAGLDKP